MRPNHFGGDHADRDRRANLVRAQPTRPADLSWYRRQRASERRRAKRLARLGWCGLVVVLAVVGGAAGWMRW